MYTESEDKLSPGKSWQHDFLFSQEDVRSFAKVTGDTNPLHLDPDYAAETAFRRPILHGMLGACVFSKVFGTLIPGPKSIYLSQHLEFKKALYPDTPYRARFEVTETDRKRVRVRTWIEDPATGEELTDGFAWLRIR
jgi:acyl dehydratase